MLLGIFWEKSFLSSFPKCTNAPSFLGRWSSNQGEDPKLSVLSALRACEGSPVSQACAGIEELRKQRVASGTEGERGKVL